MRIRRILVALMLVAAPMLALAQDDVNPVPEPATLALLGLGAVALVVAGVKKRK